MNANQIQRVLEVLFNSFPDEGEEGRPEPLNKRFQWKDPVFGQKPPPPPQEILPTGEETEEIHVPTSDFAEEPVDIPVRDMSDRVGRHALGDIISKSEWATFDQLLDRYLQMKQTQGPEAAKKWFDMYRTAEFESVLQRLVNLFLGS